MRKTLLLLTLLLTVPVLGAAQDLPAPGPDPAPAAPEGLCPGTVGENPTAIPQKGPPFPNGFCRFSCGSIRCETSADCPDGAPCDPFIVCPFRGSDGTSGDTAPAASPNGALGESCPGDAPSCFLDRQCDSYCGMKGFGACEWFCCACLG
jgi:hypothetical protein